MKKNDNNLTDEMLRKALAPAELPDKNLNDQVLRMVKEKEIMKQSMIQNTKKRIPAAVVAAACAVMICSGTAFAAYKYLTPAEIATETKDDALQKAFQTKDAIYVNETQISGGYKITLLGSVAGRHISSFLMTDGQGSIRDDRIYTVLAIERADGTPMPDTSSDEYGNEPLFASNYVRGLNPGIYNAMSMNGGYSEFVRNGIAYRIMEMDNIEMFADKGIYTGINSGSFYDSDAYLYNESTGEMTRNENYQGVNALFEIPVDKSKADAAAAEAYLKQLEKEWNTPDEPLEKDANDISVDEFMARLTPENIEEYAKPIESTRQTCDIRDGLAYYSYELENGAGTQGSLPVEDLFPDNKPGMCSSFNYSYDETGLENLLIDVFILNEDKSITYVAYQPK